ncbi:hypothetical protein [Embleya sp. NPDC050493]|uniref:hypothetical protein n=1 Tax=Embleya sp. NPDC050493 TaxID=3363989 RepID=UPI0037A84824
MASALPTRPDVQRLTRVLAWLALAVAALGVLALAVLVIGGLFVGREPDLATIIGLPILAVLAIPLPGIGVLVAIRDRTWFRILSLAIVPPLVVFALLTLMLGVGYTYLLSAALLLLACGSTFTPGRGSRANVPADLTGRGNRFATSCPEPR